jgi:GAF domain-containing protein
VAAPRELRIADAVVSLADTIRADFDVSDLLYSLTRYCVELLGVDTAGVLLADENDQLQTVASSHHHIELLELFQAQHDQGPCVDAHHTGELVSAPHLEDAAKRWPEFVGRASAVGVQSVHAVPLKLHNHVVGALGLFGHDTGPLPDGDLVLAEHLAAATTVALLHLRAQRSSQVIAEQLQHALNSRVIIEQAKGLLAERHRLPLDEAFALLRKHARSHGQRLITVARETIEGQLDPK